MARGYNPIPYAALAAKLTAIKAVELAPGTIPTTHEIVFDLPIISKSGKAFPFIVRIYTSINQHNHATRDCGKDVIRVMLIVNDERKYTKSVKVLQNSKKILRTGTTEAIIDRIVERCRDMFKLGMDPYHKCPSCETGLMVEKTNRKVGNKFRGCTNHPTCNHTDNNVQVEEK